MRSATSHPRRPDQRVSRRRLNSGPHFRAGHDAAAAGKLTAALAVVEVERRALIWTEDTALPSGVDRERLLGAGQPTLLSAPRPGRGLRPADLDAVPEFCAACA